MAVGLIRFVGAPVSAAALSMAGCASTATPAAPKAPIICKVGPDCEAKWSRAVSWITTNSRYKIQTQSDQLIQTMGPTESAVAPAYIATKTATGPGVFQISLNGGCDNWTGCIPTIPEARARFASFVNGI